MPTGSTTLSAGFNSPNPSDMVSDDRLSMKKLAYLKAPRIPRLTIELRISSRVRLPFASVTAIRRPIV